MAPLLQSQHAQQMRSDEVAAIGAQNLQVQLLGFTQAAHLMVADRLIAQ